MKDRNYYMLERLKFSLIVFGIAGLVALASQCFGQDVVITKKDSTVVELTIIATSSTQLYTKTGNILKSDIAKIDFKTQNDRDTNLYDDLKSRGIVVSFNKQIYTKEVNKVADVQNPIATVEKPIDHLYSSLEKFRKQRTIGKGMQILGVLSVGAALIISNSSNNPDKDLLKALSIGGAAVSGIGFIIDFDAGKHIRFAR